MGISKKGKERRDKDITLITVQENRNKSPSKNHLSRDLSRWIDAFTIGILFGPRAPQ